MKLIKAHPWRAVVALVAAFALFGGGVATASSLRPKPTETVYNIPPLANGSVNPNPFLANGVGIGRNVDVYFSAGIGPSGVNAAAPAGTPERFIDYALLQQLFPDFNPSQPERAAGVLPPGITVTEAQGLNNMERIRENLAAAGVGLDQMTYMRIYLEAPPGATRADYAGWNRAYRKYMANINRVTGEVIPAFAPVIVPNATRPARANIEVATLPVNGWLIEIEAMATYPQ